MSGLESDANVTERIRMIDRLINPHLQTLEYLKGVMLH